MKFQIHSQLRKVGILAMFTGGLLWLGVMTVNAEDTAVSDTPTVSALTQKKTAEKRETEQAAAEKAAAEAAAQVALATNMVSEVTVEYTSNTYPAGQCTWGAKEMAPWVGNYWGNAGDWAASAASLGYEVGTIPKVGAIAVWTDENGGYGHVAYVTDAATDGQIQVMESNYAGSFIQVTFVDILIQQQPVRER